MRISSREPVACGIDIGSTNIKVVIMDRDGIIRGRAARATPRDPDGLCIDVRVLIDTIDHLIAEACGSDYEAHALCTVGIGEDGVLVDAGRRPLTPALAWFDPRRHAVLHSLRQRLRGSEPLDAEIDPARTLVGWAWARAQPGADSAQAWLAVTDLPSALWSGCSFLSDTLASRTGAWRSSERTWDVQSVASTLGSLELLPPVERAGTVVGEVRSSALRGTGVIADDALVVVGGHDHPIGGWAVDRMVPGAVFDSMGTAEVVVAQSSRRPEAARTRVDLAPGICSGGVTLLRVEELARNVAWASQDPAVGDRIRALLGGGAEPAPVLEEGHFIPGRRGGGSPRYTADAPRDPHARASSVLGALACLGREVVAAVSGEVETPPPVRLGGGWSRSPGWLAIKEKVNGVGAVPIAEPEVTAAGAALLAATARGWRPDPTAALSAAAM